MGASIGPYQCALSSHRMETVEKVDVDLCYLYPQHKNWTKWTSPRNFTIQTWASRVECRILCYLSKTDGNNVKSGSPLGTPSFPHLGIRGRMRNPLFSLLRKWAKWKEWISPSTSMTSVLHRLRVGTARGRPSLPREWTKCTKLCLHQNVCICSVEWMFYPGQHATAHFRNCVFR